MSESTWYKTDNVAKVFLASFNRRDTRSMRVGCTLDQKVDPEILEQALMNTVSLRPQFQVRIRRGFFWHYIETTDVKPVVREETGRPCPLLYGNEYSGILHYQVTYYNKRINLDMFHALSDGTGAFEFFNVLLGEYLKLAHPDTLSDITTGSGASDADLTQDSYKQYYDKKESTKHKAVKAYHPRGRKLPYDQLQFMEISMDCDKVRHMAKEMGVGLTGFFGALIMLSMYKDMPALLKKLPITASIPVNLRKYFPSETSRNFFNSIHVSSVLKPEDTIQDIAKRIDVELKENLQPEKIAEQMDSYQKLERLLFIRMVPLIVKQPVVRYFSKQENKTVSFVISNMGEIPINERLKPYVEEVTAFCAHPELFFTLFSYGGRLKMGVSNAYSDTRTIKNLVRMLSDMGLDITVNATEVIR